MHRTGGKPSWADMCRQRAADAKQRAAQARDLSVKRAFEEVAAVPSRVVLEFGDAISGISRVSGQAARSIG